VHDGEEAHRDEHRGPLAPQVLLGALPALLADPAAEPGAAQPRPEGAADAVPEDLTRQGADDARGDGRCEAARQPGGEGDHRLARHEQPEEERGLDGGRQDGHQQHDPLVQGLQPVDEGGDHVHDSARAGPPAEPGLPPGRP
jgi:hypothetical protein